MEETDVKFLLIGCFCIGQVASLWAEGGREMLIVVGEPGNLEFGKNFQKQAVVWKKIAERGGFEVVTIGTDEEQEGGDRPMMEEAIGKFGRTGGELWLVMLGHGTYDGKTARYNLRGPDISSGEFGKLLSEFERRLVILNLFSASALFLEDVAGKDRILISANRSAGQKNYSRFGEKLAEVLTTADADMDLDGSVSLLEAVLLASERTERFYEDAQRVLQENAVIEDNGDRRATPADAFKGFMPEISGEESVPDGAEARDVYFLKTGGVALEEGAKAERARLEMEIFKLRKGKAKMGEDEYYMRLEELMKEMAAVYGIVGKGGD